MPQKKWPRPPKTTMLCRICGEAKGEDGFHPSNWRDAITRSKCKQCLLKYQKHRYDNGYSQNVDAGRRERLNAVSAIKAERGCRDCGESHPACLDFHHRNKTEKTVAVGSLVSRTTKMEKLLAEIAKCDVVCSNCHRKHHFKNGGQGRPKKLRPEGPVGEPAPTGQRR